jgi:predicted phage terminase large subunit-like protein
MRSHTSEASLLLELQPALERQVLKRAAKTNLIEFTRYTFPKYAPADLHHQIAEQLERVERGEIDRLMLHVPPRHGKSELASRRFPAWYLGRHPDRQFISASASTTLAEDFGRDVRNLIASQEYADVFDTRLSEDAQARGRWTTQEGGSYFATGVGGAIMGRGAHVLLIDDPFGSMADARSEIERRRVHEWYTGTCYNRLEKGGAIVLINQRMHQDDLSGRLLAQQAAGGDQWTVVELKALSPSGEALWPEKFDIDALERIKRNITPQDWAALYQQEPTQEVGSFFKAEWLRPHVDDPPKHLSVYGGSDYAVTADGGDYTVHVVIGIDDKGRMFLLDLWRKQADPKEWVEAYCDLVLKWKPSFWATERTQITSGIGPYLEQRSMERRAFIQVEQFPTRGDKGVRCQSIRGRMSQIGMFVPADARWLSDLRAELLAFPTGKHDDQVDALGLVGQLLDKFSPAYVPRPKEPDDAWDKAYGETDTYGDALRDSILVL